MGGTSMVGRVLSIAENAREMFEGMPGLRSEIAQMVDNSGTSQRR
jgi:hypothetical protein